MIVQLLGCGDDDGKSERIAIDGAIALDAHAPASDGGTSEELPREQLVSELSPTDNARVCRVIARHLLDVHLSTTRAGCIGEVLGKPRCAMERERCISGAFAMNRAGECEQTPDQLTGGASCTVSFGELEACFEALAEAARDFVDAATCEKSVEDLVALQAPSECTSIADRCQQAVFFAGE